MLEKTLGLPSWLQYYSDLAVQEYTEKYTQKAIQDVCRKCKRGRLNICEIIPFSFSIAIEHIFVTSVVHQFYRVVYDFHVYGTILKES